MHASTEGARYDSGRYFKPIEDIREGDVVLSYNESTQTVEPKRVTQTFVRQTDRIYTVRYANGAEFETTFNHEFFVKSVGWVQAVQLRPGDVSVTANGSEERIASVSGEARYETVYNFEVEDNHTYFVGRDGVLVHNENDYLKGVSAAYARDVACNALLLQACGTYRMMAAARDWLFGDFFGPDPLLEKLDELEARLMDYENLSEADQAKTDYELASMGFEIGAGGFAGLARGGGTALTRLRALKTLIQSGGTPSARVVTAPWRNQGATTVYSYIERGVVKYVGITDDVARRATEHFARKGIRIEPIRELQRLSRSDAKAVEQVLIEHHELLRNGGTLMNKINSIAASNPAYAASLRRGLYILREAGYPGL